MLLGRRGFFNYMEDRPTESFWSRLAPSRSGTRPEGDDKMSKMFRLIILLFLLAFAGGALAQESPDWTNPFPPYRVIGNIYYVGSQGLASYLITTPQGNILINSNLEKSVPMIRESVEKL